MSADNVEKVDETLLLFSKLSFGNTDNTYTVSRNINQNNGTQSSVPASFEFSSDACIDPEAIYSRVLKFHRSGRVSKKSVNEQKLKIFYFLQAMWCKKKL